MKQMLAVVLGCIAAPAIASDVTVTLPDGQKFQIPDPTEILSKYPDGNEAVYKMSQPGIDNFCQWYSAPEIPEGVACLVLDARQCQIAILDTLSERAHDQVVAHLSAHCRGWLAVD